MAWTVSISLDKDKDDVGTVAATWDQGGPEEFTYSRRATAGGGAAAAFKAEAEAALAAYLAKAAQEASLTASLTTFMNGA